MNGCGRSRWAVLAGWAAAAVWLIWGGTALGQDGGTGAVARLLQGEGAGAQDEGAREGGPGREGGDGDLAGTGQRVAVEDVTGDEAIQERLTRILAATERFVEPSVEVRDGVVFLSGAVREEGHRAWAGDLARQTEGVVAVVNDIEVLEGPLWTLEPAAAELRGLWRQVVQSLPLVAVGLVVLVLTWLVARGVVRAAARPLKRRVQSPLVRAVVEHVVLILIVLVGVYIFLRISGLTRVAVTLAGGTGLVGLVIGFAFRDIAENFLASILISMQQPFRLGDLIEVDGRTGIVQKVTMRGTVLMDFDGNHIRITNSTVYKNPIKNFTANPKMRLGFTVGIGYDSSIVKAQEVALGVLREHSAVLDDPEPLVLVEELGAATITVRVYFWIDMTRHSMLKVRSSVIRLTVRAFEEAGISLPDEAREVIFPEGVPVQMAAAGPEREEQEAVRTQALERAGKALREADESERVEGEGDLSSEVDEIKQQARQSRTPEEGEGILR